MIKHKSVNYIHFASIPSTNSWAKENAAILDPTKLTCISADEQTAARGTFSKKWISPKGVNIYATLYFALPRTYPFLHNMSQVLSVSCCTCLEKLGFFPKIKWPNDLLLEGKKFTGILCEATSFAEQIGVALGFGMNVNMTEEFINKIDQPATSLLQVSHTTWDLQEILSTIVKTFLDHLELLSAQGFSPFIPYYNEHLSSKGEMLQIKDGLVSRKGICEGISPEGLLLLALPSGETVKISSGRSS
jgi:BirA family biotin operon repressor/biotin-[acetyl-CoA-carboxylase] ligase